MKHLFLFWLFCVGIGPGFAQTSPAPDPETPSRWTAHVDSIFEHIDRSPVGTGLLLNYGVGASNALAARAKLVATIAKKQERVAN